MEVKVTIHREVTQNKCCIFSLFVDISFESFGIPREVREPGAMRGL